MLRTLCLSLFSLTLISGCADSEIVSDTADTGAAETEAAPTFAAGDTATLEIPGMSCQVACYPKIKKTLEGVEGVELVELVPQEDDVAINDHRITVKFDADVNQKDAMDALSGVGYDEVNVM